MQGMAHSGMHRAAGAALLLLLSGCAGTAPTCAPGEAAFTEARLFFGRSIAGEPGPAAVTEADWAGFVSAEIMPRFPAGFTVLDGAGHWQGCEGQGAAGVCEQTKVLMVLYPSSPNEEAAAHIAAIAEAYRTRFRQQAVLQSTATVCTRFHAG